MTSLENQEYVVYFLFFLFSCLFLKSSHLIPRHIICNFRSLFYFIYISENSWYLNKPDEDWYWPVKISQLNSISRCLISPCKSLLDFNVLNLIYFDWSQSFWIRRWARSIVHGFCSVFFYLKFALYKRVNLRVDPPPIKLCWVLPSIYLKSKVNLNHQGERFLKVS